jgi:hypothetical protein
MSLECDHVLIGGADGLSLNSIVASSTSNPVTNGDSFLPSSGRVVQRFWHMTRTRRYLFLLSDLATTATRGDESLQNIVRIRRS